LIRCPEANPRYLIKSRFWRISRSVPWPSPKAPDSGLARIRQSVHGLGYLSAAARNLPPPPDILATQIVYRLHALVVDHLNALSYNRARSGVIIFLLYPPRNRRAKLLVHRNAPIFVSPLSLFVIHIGEFSHAMARHHCRECRRYACLLDLRICQNCRRRDYRPIALLSVLIIILGGCVRGFVYPMLPTYGTLDNLM